MNGPAYITHYERGFRHAMKGNGSELPTYSAKWWKAYVNGYEAARHGDASWMFESRS
jgi:hypothetical protein